MENKILLEVNGMDCAHCASTITKSLQKKGLKEVEVNFLNGEVTFQTVPSEEIDQAVAQIYGLGYQVTGRSDKIASHDLTHEHHEQDAGKFTIRLKLILSAVFTIPLLLHMVLSISFLHNPWVQLALASPVMAIGIYHFGKSAWNSLRVGFPNMDVLILVGSTASFIYSLIGMIQFSETGSEQYLFFETAATIITLVLLGNLIEQRSVARTTTAMHELIRLQPLFAHKIQVHDGKETITEMEISMIRRGDLLQVNSGDRIPLDGKLISGDGLVDESMLTGESIPVTKTAGDELTGSTLVESGSFRMQVEKTGSETALSKIIELVKNAQRTQPRIQKLGDRISAIFVPVVIGIAILTLLLAHFVFGKSFQQSLMNSIAVLVIACPCAMGLAAPTAIMVGIGRAARNGILIRGGDTLEEFTRVKTFVFDKTGTITTGKFRIENIRVFEGTEAEIKTLLFALEQHSNHPIARSIVHELRDYADTGGKYKWNEIKEDKGTGINATDSDGTLYSAGSFKMVRHFYDDAEHSIYVLKNNKLIATVDLKDELKPGIPAVIHTLRDQGHRVILLSGDRKQACEAVALEAGISEVYSEQKPAEKLALIEKFANESVTAMIGDGINDAPALTKASIGISMSNASQVAVQSARIILLRQDDLRLLLKAMRISRLTYSTIRQNFFWAFCYNVLAIPVAAMGFLSPMIGALSMAFSDVIVIGNSLRLYRRNIDS